MFFLFLFSIIIIFVLSVFLVHFIRRLFEFDELFGLFIDDIDTNLDYLSKLLQTPTFSNSPEIVSAHKNMMIIGKRLQEYSLRIEELTNKKRNERKKPLPPPKVV